MSEINPPASLEPRATDVTLRPEQFKAIPFFAQLKAVPKLEEFPGTLLLRFFRKGEVICRQGEYGWSAFSILSDQDALQALEKYLADGARPEEKARIEGEIARLRRQDPGPAPGGRLGLPGDSPPAKGCASRAGWSGSEASSSARPRPHQLGRSTSPSMDRPTSPTTPGKRPCGTATCSAR